MWARLSIVVGLVAGIAAAALLLGGILAFAPEPAPPVAPAPSVTLVTPTPVVSPSASTDAESPVASASASGSPDPSSPAADPSPPASPGG